MSKEEPKYPHCSANPLLCVGFPKDVGRVAAIFA